MNKENENKTKLSMDDIFQIISLTFVLLIYLGFFIYFGLKELLQFNDRYALFTTLAICVFTSYKYFVSDSVTKTSHENKRPEIKTSSLETIDDISSKRKSRKKTEKSLTEDERNQIELDNYTNKKHSKEGIGLFYERYVGYIFESREWHVIYNGAKKGKEDEGIDLICMKADRVRLVQCKYWSQNKTLFENSVFQLYGTWQLRVKNSDFSLKRVDAYIVTSTTLSEFAKSSAKTLSIGFKESLDLNKDYPKIKCTTTKEGEKIYHLPTDQQYDNISMNKDLRRFYANTVVEAVAKGHRRAYRNNYYID